MANPDSATRLAVSDGSPSSSQVVAPRVGDRIGHYIVERMVGSGGMGYVVGARHEQLGGLAAVKLLHPRAKRDPVQLERFLREAKSLAKIQSENVVRVLDVGQQEKTGAPYIVMEYLEGEDLGAVLQRSGPLPPEVAVDYMLQVCEAVATAHALGIIHRDLKPSNLFLTRRPDGSPLVKVLDFGISKAMVDDAQADPRLTDTQAVFGSPTYMSPEQIRSAKKVDARADIWSLGVALFELLTGKLPFIADNIAGLLASIVADPPLRASTFAQLPPGLDAVIGACLEKDASRRIGSAVELASRLRPFASQEGQLLAERLARRSSATSQSPLDLPRASVPAPAPSAPPLAMGTTGVDLAEVAPHPRGKRAVIAVVLGALGIAVVGVAAIAVRARPEKRVTASKATAEPTAIAIAALPTSDPTPTATPAAPVAAPPAESGSGTSAKPAPRPLSPRVQPRGPAAGSPKASSTAAPAPSPPTSPAPTKDPTSDRL